ncbi:MAG: hypothetical protein U9N83_05680 [Thermodesulfobacteriota bacterium]|nr:hypothetical protein [Thermodesulfobacteriota bacterium]
MKRILIIALFAVLFFSCKTVQHQRVPNKDHTTVQHQRVLNTDHTTVQHQRVSNKDRTSDDIKGTKGIGTKILMLYKERDPDHEGILHILTGFIDKAGFTWDKMDVEKLLMEKDKINLSQYKGIMTCYQTSRMVGGDVYPYWLVKQMEAGRRILIIGSYGAYQGLIPKPDGTLIERSESIKTINTFFRPFGLEFRFGWTGEVKNLSITKKVEDMVEHEVKLKPEDINYYQFYKSVNPENRVYLEIERKDMFDSKSAFIVHTPFGGMILEGYGYLWDSKKKKTLQRVDMVRFIKEALEGDTL